MILETVHETILGDIAAEARKRVERDKERLSLLSLIAQTENMSAQKSHFGKVLSKKGKLSFICEVKRASPSKGLIAADFPYLKIAGEYAEAGAEAISVLTEPKFFQGSDKYLAEIAEKVSPLPCLRKDFIIDEYQIFQAKLLGAQAVLLICALLDGKTLKKFALLAENIGLEALVEAHDEAEIACALDSGAKIIGINSRNLKNFTVDTEKTLKMRSLIPENCVAVAESGVKTREDTQKIEEAGFDAALVGETLMRAKDKKAALAVLRGLAAENGENGTMEAVS